MSYRHIEELIERKPWLAKCKESIERFCDALIMCFRNGGKVIVCGNGGSCSDSGHIVGELMKGFHRKRPLSSELRDKLAEFGEEELANKLQTPLRAIDLTAMSSLCTAIANDIDADCIYAQQALAYTDPGDVFIGISTSGNARNIHYAAVAAKSLGAVIIGMTGLDGGSMNGSGLYDICIQVPESKTYRIQEEHISVYHAVCLDTERFFFSE